MRLKAILCEGCALELMHEARTVYWSEESAAHTEENWSALMKTMAALEMEVPEEYMVDAADLPGLARPPPSVKKSAKKTAYDPEDPRLDHSAFAVRFAEAGEELAAEQAFRAAVKHGKSAGTLIDLGVCLMRMKAILCEGCALELMHEARTVYWSEESAAHVEGNWNALMKTMAALEMEVPEEYRLDDVNVVGQAPTPTTGASADEDVASE